MLITDHKAIHFATNERFAIYVRNKGYIRKGRSLNDSYVSTLRYFYGKQPGKKVSDILPPILVDI